MTHSARTLTALLCVCAAACAAALPLAAQSGPGPLFPEPFRVTHHLVQEDGEGSRFVGEPVVDTYGGSWIVSQRPDGSRLVIDLDRRELTGIEKDKGTYWTVSLDRFAELQRLLRAAQSVAGTAGKDADQDQDKSTDRRTAAKPSDEPELVVTEVQGDGERRAVRTGEAVVADRPGVKRLRVSRAGSSLLDVWVDPSVRLNAAALGAMSSLETALTGPASDAVPPGRSLAAARAQAGGAFAVRTLRPLAGVGQVEDVATQLERLERFPSDLVEIPEGLRRVPHPLEAAVRFLDDERERDRAMAGLPASPSRP
jgi:hypothetical protein